MIEWLSDEAAAATRADEEAKLVLVHLFNPT